MVSFRSVLTSNMFSMSIESSSDEDDVGLSSYSPNMSFDLCSVVGKLSIWKAETDLS